MNYVNIYSMDNDTTRFAFDLDFIKENSRSIYAEGMYLNIYRIEKATGKVYIDGKQVANTSEWTVL